MFESVLKLAVAALLLASPARAAHDESLAVSLRYRAHSARENLVDPSVLYALPVLPWAAIELGARVGVTSSRLETFDYKVELKFPLLSFFSVGTRLYQSNHFSLGSGITQLFAHGDLNIPVFSFLDVTASVGIHKRYTALSRTFVLPGISHTSFTDHDGALALGFRAHPASDWSASLGLATFEAFDVFNLNGPFFQLTAEHRLAGESLSVTGSLRHRLLLGFGRRNETAIALGVRWDFGGLSRASSPSS